jgi:hypothetical protein
MTGGEVAKKLLGAWRYVGTRINGGNWDRGANPTGMIYYGPHGEMAVQIAPDVKRTRAGAVMTADEAFTAVKDYIVYFGTYTVDEAHWHRHPSSPRQPAAGR